MGFKNWVEIYYSMIYDHHILCIIIYPTII